ncbi:MAG: enoyl-CoA hydratase/isomerase family protein [Desulfarculaceae bacterium]
MGSGPVHYEIRDQVGVVTINNPPMNALDVTTKNAIGSAFQELDGRRQEIRAVILHGAGEKAFAAGADIKTFLDLVPDTGQRYIEGSQYNYNLVENFPWPVIAAIHGFCLGGALELALFCDIRYADQSAKFGFPEANLSFFPANGGLKRALYHLPVGKLKELIYTGRIFDADEAMSLGLVEKVVPAGQVMDAAWELAEQIKTKGPLGIASVKKVINRTRDLSLKQDQDLECEIWSHLTDTADMREGVRAFLEKRKPQYKGE